MQLTLILKTDRRKHYFYDSIQLMIFLCDSISDKNEVFGWGNSEYNQLDLNNGTQQINTPIHLKKVQKCGKIIDIASGGSACMVLNGN